ncbi:DUF1800 family protein [Novosphingobium sp. P6W]|uniref:DUF1800 domain-containing protein n=1 Tax=Novosphingobium sp. P6W TaxID=1609758 RepID=UPI0005C32459|nr:DUF1800 domain-containing protein [Novosphingobium sp. P6W]AXB76642.1 DUF1800 domain-containing protein [Novosphingobium sp. P6W]KIS29858.1 hypothetical protein TQ38_26025 [Novosphingobium sp. P6W]
MTIAIALNRFGLGARPDETLSRDPKGFLLDQFGRYEARPPAWASLPGSHAIAADYIAERQEVRSTQGDAKRRARMDLRKDGRDLLRVAANARAVSALTTPTPFVERLVHFWSNHFAISADKQTVIPFAGAFEAEAIRPHVLGRFEDMLLAVERHPAMQLFLDQAQSVGPGSAFARRATRRDPKKAPGLNENLAREIMELHTLGARAGYTQADVTEFARALTGWSTAGLGRGGKVRAGAGDPGSFVFRPMLHEPGTRTIMGRSYAQQGEGQALAILGALAAAPSTADHIATKLARHFVADEPPPALVARLSAAFRESSGDLPAVYRALVVAPESWAPASAKFKTPWEWLISSMRGLGMSDANEIQVAGVMLQLGQPVWRPGSPAGFDDVAASWAAPDALLRRVEMAQRLAARATGAIDPRELAPKLLPGNLAPATAQAIARAESLPTGLALLLVSPEFLRR